MGGAFPLLVLGPAFKTGEPRPQSLYPKRVYGEKPWHRQRMDSATSNDHDLAAVEKAWDQLPQALKAGILAMIKAATS
jgi:hypothetical protein